MKTTANMTSQTVATQTTSERFEEEMQSPLSGKVYFRNREDSNLYFARNAIALFPASDQEAVAHHLGVIDGVTKSKDDENDVRVIIFKKDGVRTSAFVAKDKKLSEMVEPYFQITEVYDPETQTEEVRVWIMEAPTYIDTKPEALQQAASLLGW